MAGLGCSIGFPREMRIGSDRESSQKRSMKCEMKGCIIMKLTIVFTGTAQYRWQILEKNYETLSNNQYGSENGQA